VVVVRGGGLPARTIIDCLQHIRGQQGGLFQLWNEGYPSQVAERYSKLHEPPLSHPESKSSYHSEVQKTDSLEELLLQSRPSANLRLTHTQEIP
jgi:hypothetical protein